MSKQEILAEVAHVLREKLAVAVTIRPESDLLRDLQLDSIKQLELVVEVENHFRICFEPGDEAGIATIGDLVRVIKDRLVPAAPCAEAPAHG